MRRFLTPRWLVAHVVVIGAVATCTALGLWQLDRLEQRRETNARILQRGAEPVAPLPDLIEPDAPDPETLAFRRVRVRGVYDVEGQVVLVGRSLEGQPGNHLLTPLVTEEGWAVLVERGWVPYDVPPVEATAPPQGEVEVVGTVLASEGPAEPVDGGTRIQEVDLAAIGASVPYPLEPVYVRLSGQRPPPEGLPIPVSPPATDEGPHLSYAVQWFLFGATAFVVYGALVRKELRRPRRPGADGVSGAEIDPDLAPGPDRSS